MASYSTWQKVKKYFSPHSIIDSWGDPDLIADEFVLALYDFRVFLGYPIYVLHGVKSNGHAPKSYHYFQNGACAGDVIIPNYTGSAFNLILAATRFGFTGIGYYPHWRDRQGLTVGGLHLDRRPLRWDADKTKNYSHSRWMGVLVPDKESETEPTIFVQRYIGLNYENIVKYS